MSPLVTNRIHDAFLAVTAAQAKYCAAFLPPGYPITPEQREAMRVARDGYFDALDGWKQQQRNHGYITEAEHTAFHAWLAEKREESI